ncbi:MAG TPA: pyridoxamine 5'-phosphate oxidase family protein [Opitutus sp.]|nr:pyridoxamine 5'-phosphate oxidase family protein [Opitutus sp.]
MAKFFPELSPAHRRFIAEQKIFFVASAPADGRVNLSPKGMDTFRVLNAKRIGYLDATGSGNETAAHLADNGRLTVMFCAFAGAPLILRVYGRGRSVQPRDADWTQLRPLFGPPIPGERQLIVADVESVQTSCGFAVPLMNYEADRTILNDWAEKKGPDGVAAYWAEKNQRSIDGLPTGLLSEP